MDLSANSKYFHKFSAFGIIVFILCILIFISCSSSEQKTIKSQKAIETIPVDIETSSEQSSRTALDETSAESQTAREQTSLEIPHIVPKEEKKFFLKAIAPFGIHEERYQVLFDSLLESGMKPGSIKEIFASKRAKQIDKTAVKIMSRRVVGKPSVRTKRKTSAVANMLKNHLNLYTQYYDYIESSFGVNREIAAAILYKETRLGKFKNWTHDAFTVLNSLLSFLEIPDESEDRQRARMERTIATVQKSLTGLLLYCHKYQIDITNTEFPSSFAGAIGFPQFMPMYMDYVISIDNNTPDLSHMPDAIVSLGNLLKNKFGWPGYMDFNKLENIDEIIAQYVEFDKKEQGVSFSVSVNLDGYPLRNFSDEFNTIANIEYVAKYAASLMNYNYSSDYVLDVLLYAFHTHRLNQTKN